MNSSDNHPLIQPDISKLIVEIMQQQPSLGHSGH